MKIWMLFFLAAGAVAHAAEPEFVMAAIGDSITTGFNAAKDKPLQNRFFSWSTGASRDVESHAMRLRDQLKVAVRFKNVAYPYAQAETIPAQVAEVIALKPSYVTLLIGANDMCDWPYDYQARLAQFAAPIKKGIEALIQANPKVKILIVPIPDMYRLYQLGLANGCQKLWEDLKYCKPLLAPTTPEDQKRQFITRVKDANQQLGQLAAAYPQNVKYPSELENAVFDFDDISNIDCYHPSIKGQKKLSAESWKSGWYK